MSHDDSFQDSSSFFHMLLALIVLVAMPLLPMLMGWLKILS